MNFKVITARMWLSFEFVYAVGADTQILGTLKTHPGDCNTVGLALFADIGSAFNIRPERPFSTAISWLNQPFLSTLDYPLPATAALTVRAFRHGGLSESRPCLVITDRFRVWCYVKSPVPTTDRQRAKTSGYCSHTQLPFVFTVFLRARLKPHICSPLAKSLLSPVWRLSASVAWNALTMAVLTCLFA